MDPAEAAALAGTVSTVVGSVVAGLVAASVAGVIPPNPGAMALIGQLQVLSQIGSIGGGGGAMGAFSDGFSWANGDGLFTMFPEGDSARRRGSSRRKKGARPPAGQTAGEASEDCNDPELTDRERSTCLECGLIDGQPLLDKLMLIVVSIGVVFCVRAFAQLLVTKWWKKDPWDALTFPNWEGPLLLTHVSVCVCVCVCVRWGLTERESARRERGGERRGGEKKGDRGRERGRELCVCARACIANVLYMYICICTHTHSLSPTISRLQ